MVPNSRTDHHFFGSYSSPKVENLLFCRWRNSASYATWALIFLVEIALTRDSRFLQYLVARRLRKVSYESPKDENFDFHGAESRLTTVLHHCARPRRAIKTRRSFLYFV
ncbi:hypothetical protein Ddc_15904 [Ditylenchus destructor]|nr:hypothetical protein Ddc_15904 [Ditylenchus destructor]